METLGTIMIYSIYVAVALIIRKELPKINKEFGIGERVQNFIARNIPNSLIIRTDKYSLLMTEYEKFLKKNYEQDLLRGTIVKLQDQIGHLKFEKKELQTQLDVEKIQKAIILNGSKKYAERVGA